MHRVLGEGMFVTDVTVMFHAVGPKTDVLSRSTCPSGAQLAPQRPFEVGVGHKENYEHCVLSRRCLSGTFTAAARCNRWLLLVGVQDGKHFI